MALVFVAVVTMSPFFGFAAACWPGGSDIMVPLISIYRVPLLALFAVFPTLLYVNAAPARKRKLTVRGLAHAILTIGIVMGACYFFDWLTPETVWFFLIISIVGYLICRICVFIAYNIYIKIVQRRQKAEHELRKKEAEQNALQHYTDEMERQNTAVRKFRHDYQNILLSIDSFIQEKDFVGLEKYYVTKIKAASEIMIKEEFSLQNLSKIKVREIKSILTGKLMSVQSSDMEVTFEADVEIDDFFVDSIALVRIIGIILDNAIEACEELSGGKLLTGCFKEESEITIIVQNTCRSDIPKLYQLLQEGFSTKGEGRGFGLSNLQELVASHANITLETNVTQDNFIQKLRIRRV